MIAPAVAGGIISTFAGGGPSNGDAALSTSIGPSCAVADANGNLYICSADRILKMAIDGTITVVAGNGVHGLSGDNGPAEAAMLYNPRALAIDASGNIYIVDTSNNRVRKVDTSGIITTFAGTGHFQYSGYSGDNGPASLAELSNPEGIAVDSSGNVYISDSGNNCIRKVAANGIITSIAGNGIFCVGSNGAASQASLTHPSGLAVDSSGNLFIAQGNGVIQKLTPNGAITPVNVSMGGILAGLAIDVNGNLYAADFYKHRILKVLTDGTSVVVAGSGTLGFSGDGGPAIAADLSLPFGVAVGATGQFYIADSGNYRVRKVDASGIINTVAGNGKVALSGDGGPATSAQLLNPNGIALDVSGNMYIADTWNNAIRKVTASGVISTVAGYATGGTGANGFLGYNGYGGDNGPANQATLSGPVSVAVDASGNIYFTDQGNHCIRKVGTNGVINAIVGICGGNHYDSRGWYFSGDNGPAISALLDRPNGITLDPAGNLYIADSNNDRIRKVDVNGVITTIAGNGTPAYAGDNGPATLAQMNPTGVAFDPNGNLYIADYGNDRIRRIATDGIITTVAGNGTHGFSGDNGPATSAQLNGPFSVRIDAAGNLYIADYFNERIRKVDTNGVITTVAGNGVVPAGFAGDGVPAISAQLYGPADVAIDSVGNLYIADVYNQRIRKVSAPGTIDIFSGWNLLGNGNDAPLDVSATFADTAKITTVWKWVPATSKWAFYTPSMTALNLTAYAASKGYDVLTAINGGEGFWVNAKTAFTAQLPVGTSISAAYFQDQFDPAQNKLLKGWNLIAVGDSITPSLFNQALSVTPPAQGVIPLNVTTLWAWDSALSNWYFYAPSLEANGGLTNYIASKNYLDFAQHNKTLGRGVGFWVNRP